MLNCIFACCLVLIVLCVELWCCLVFSCLFSFYLLHLFWCLVHIGLSLVFGALAPVCCFICLLLTAICCLVVSVQTTKAYSTEHAQGTKFEPTNTSSIFNH